MKTKENPSKVIIIPRPPQASEAAQSPLESPVAGGAVATEQTTKSAGSEPVAEAAAGAAEATAETEAPKK